MRVSQSMWTPGSTRSSAESLRTLIPRSEFCPASSVCVRTDSTTDSSSCPSISPRWTSRPTRPLSTAFASSRRWAVCVSALWANWLPRSTCRSSSFSGSAIPTTLTRCAGNVQRRARHRRLRGHGLRREAGRRVPGQGRRGSRARGPLAREARGARDRPAADRGRRRPPGGVGAQRTGGGHDGRPVPQGWDQARRRLRRGGHRVLRPDGRGAVRARRDRAPRGGAGVRRADRALVRVRLDPVGPRHVPAARSGGRAGGDDAGGQGAARRRSAAGRSRR